MRLVLAGLTMVSLAHASALIGPSQGIPAWVTPLRSDGSRHAGVVGTSEDRDYFRFEVAELAEAVVYTTGSVDTVGAILDLHGREIASNDDDGDSDHFRIAVLLQAGEYYVRVASAMVSLFGNTTTGSYNLHAEATLVSAPQLSLDGTPREGSIGGHGDADYFRFEVTELAEVAAYTTGSVDTVGAVLDSEGREIASNDDGDDSGNSRVSALLGLGEYFVRVTLYCPYSSIASCAIGSYNMHVTAPPLSPRRLALDGTSQESVIETQEDADLYRFEVTEATGVLLYTTGLHDTEGALLDSQGREIVADDDGGESGNFEIFSVIRPGEYYLQVTAPFEFSAATYALQAEGKPVLPIPLSLTGSPRTGATEGPDDAEIYHVNVHEVAEVVFYTTGRLNTAALLFGADGRVPTGALGDQGDFRLGTLLWPGDYYMVVGASPGGSYALHVESTALNLVPMRLGGPAKGRAIESPPSADCFHVEVSGLTAAAIYSTGGLNTAARLYDPDGREVAANDDGGEGFVNFRISAVLFRPGNYLLRVSSSSGSAGTYTLFAEGTP